MIILEVDVDLFNSIALLSILTWGFVMAALILK